MSPLPNIARVAGLLLTVMLLFLALPASGEGVGEAAAPPNLKAVFIFNFIKYLDWPGEGELKQYTVGILGKSELEPPFLEIAKKKKAKGRRIAVRRYSNLKDLSECQILYYGKGEWSIEEVIDAVKGKPVVLVSDGPGYARAGSAINFVLINQKQRFEINIDVLQKARINVNSQLLNLAIVLNRSERSR